MPVSRTGIPRENSRLSTKFALIASSGKGAKLSPSRSPRRTYDSPIRPPLWLRSMVMALLVLIGTVAAAQQPLILQPPDELFSPDISISHFDDDNLFRLPAGVTPQVLPGQTERSDDWTVTSLGFKIDKEYSLQRFTLEADVDRYDYSTYHFLDFTAFNGNANWAWSATPDVTGHLIFTRTEVLNSFTDFAILDERNININQTRRFDIDWSTGGAIHVGGAVDQLVQSNTSPVYELEDVRINSVEPFINYVSVADNSIGLYGRASTGDYINQVLNPAYQVDTGFTEHEVGARATYIVDGQTNLFAQIGFLARDNDHFGSRNFHGVDGVLNWTWDLSGKTTLVTTATRTLSAYETPESSYLIYNKITVGPTWEVTDQVALGMRLQDTQYRFEGALTPQPILRDDLIHSVQLLAQWQPVRELTLLSSLTHSFRNSNFPGLQFSDQIVSIGAILKF